MTVPAARTAPTAQAAPVSPRARDIWRRARGPVAGAVFVLFVALVLGLVAGAQRRGYLDPAAADPSGSRALVQILAQRGTHVVTADTVEEARAAATPGAIVVVTRSAYLLPDALRRLAALPGDRLLVEPTAAALAELAPGVSPAGTAPVEPRRPACLLPAGRLAGDADTGGRLYDSGVPGALLCYAAGGHASVVRLGVGGHTVTVLGTGQPLTNGRLADRGNAALALNLLGDRPTVVWLYPRLPQPAAAAPRPLTSLLPARVKHAALQLVIGVVLIALWRMRRLGPVVAEPLPVVVRAAETVEGRARLYRARRARDRAAAALRDGARARLVPRLGLPPDATPSAVVAAVAERTGLDAPQIGALLYGPPPGDDAALVRLADLLDALEREVRQS